MPVAISLTLIFTYVLASMIYIYHFRGETRYEAVSEYLRKGWPIFAPFNCLLYLFTQSRAKKPIMDMEQFSELGAIRDNWEIIRGEVLELHNKGYFDASKDTEAGSYYDIGFRTFYKYGWSKFYLKWYGYTHQSAKDLCPKTVEILRKIPSVNGAMFTVLPAESKLTRHIDPVACSMRYHLALSTPNSEDCFINIDGTRYSWQDGQAFMFDETYLHYAENNANQNRLILMCDVERPSYFIGSIVNFFYKFLVRFTVVPNIKGDKRGLVNLMFSSLTPVLQKSKKLKQTNRNKYLLLKYSVNFTLFIIVGLILLGFLTLSSHLAS